MDPVSDNLDDLYQKTFYRQESQTEKQPEELSQDDKIERFLNTFFVADSLQQISSKPMSAVYLIERQNRPFIVKLYLSQYSKDIQLMLSIFNRRNPLINNRYELVQCRYFKHPVRLGLKCPVLPDRKLVETNFSQPSDRRSILLAFFEKIMRGISEFFYSLENTFFDKGQLSFNQSSIVGLMPLIKKDYFQKEDLRQVFELLNPQMLGQANDRRTLITQNSKFRAIAMLILFLITEERVSLVKEEDFGGKEKVSFKQVKGLVVKISKRFTQFLQEEGIIQRIEKAEKEDNVRYFDFLRKVFNDNCKDITWSSAASLLFPQYEPRADEGIKGCLKEKQEPKADNGLRGCLKKIAQALFLKEDLHSQNALLQLGLVKKDTQGQFDLINEDTYLHYMLPTASYMFKSVADQICQRQLMTQGEKARFQRQLIKIVSQMEGKQYATELLLQIGQYLTPSEHYIRLMEFVEVVQLQQIRGKIIPTLI